MTKRTQPPERCKIAGTFGHVHPGTISFCRQTASRCDTNTQRLAKDVYPPSPKLDGHGIQGVDLLKLRPLVYVKAQVLTMKRTALHLSCEIPPLFFFKCAQNIAIILAEAKEGNKVMYKKQNKKKYSIPS
jgi:hypothetical protein